MILVTKLRPGEGIEILGEAKCQPCNHRNHKPTFALQFTGKAYKKATLEEIEGDSDSDDDSASDGSADSDKASVNSKGFALPSQEKVWMSGRYAFIHSSVHLFIPSLSLFLPHGLNLGID
jgi:hypothetical protein